VLVPEVAGWMVLSAAQGLMDEPTQSANWCGGCGNKSPPMRCLPGGREVGIAKCASQ